MLIAVVLSLAVLTAAALLALFHRRRSGAGNAAANAARRRAVLEDRGDDAVWQAGKRRSIAESRDVVPGLTKRAFLRRLALGVSAFAIGLLASRGKAGAQGLSRQPGDEQLPRKHGKMPVDNDHQDWGSGHADSTDHVDQHSDGGEDDNHMDSHSDSAGNHTDNDGHYDSGHNDMNSQTVSLTSSQRPPEDDLLRKHNPMKIDAHQDSSDHSDIHSDGGGDSHTDSHSDSAGNHTDTGG